MNNDDVRLPIADILKDNSPTDVILVNTPSRWKGFREGDFDLPYQHLERSAKNEERLYGDQDFEPNHGVLMVCSKLRENGIRVKLIDLHTLYFLKYKKIINFDVDEYFFSSIKKSKAKIIGFSSMTPNLKTAISYAKTCRKFNSSSKYIIGGIATISENECLEEDVFDIAVCEEGEVSFLNLVQRILAERDYKDVHGIAYKDENKITKTPSQKSMGWQELFPAYDLLPVELPLIPRLYTARGCGNRCDFCSPENFFQNSLSFREERYIEEDIRYLHNNFEFDWFNLGDLTLFLKSVKVQRICEFLSKGNFKPWWCQTQVNQLTELNIPKLAEANCSQVALGFEDFSNINSRIQAKVRNKERAIKTCELLHDHNILVQGYWLFGTPEETFESSLQKINDICEFIRNRLVDTIHITYLIPYPNTFYINKPDEIVFEKTDYSRFLNLSSGFYNIIPMHHTKNLTAKEIFLLMQLATESCANEFSYLAINYP